MHLHLYLTMNSWRKILTIQTVHFLARLAATTTLMTTPRLMWMPLLISTTVSTVRIYHSDGTVSWHALLHQVRVGSLTWWRHQMETFSALLALCAGNSPVTGEFPSQRSVTRNFDVFFDLRLNKRLNKQSRGWWCETLSRSLWRHPSVHFSSDSTTSTIGPPQNH